MRFKNVYRLTCAFGTSLGNSSMQVLLYGMLATCKIILENNWGICKIITNIVLSDYHFHIKNWSWKFAFNNIKVLFQWLYKHGRYFKDTEAEQAVRYDVSTSLRKMLWLTICKNFNSKLVNYRYWCEWISYISMLRKKYMGK